MSGFSYQNSEHHKLHARPDRRFDNHAECCWKFLRELMAGKTDEVGGGYHAYVSRDEDPELVLMSIEMEHHGSDSKGPE